MYLGVNMNIHLGDFYSDDYQRKQKPIPKGTIRIGGSYNNSYGEKITVSGYDHDEEAFVGFNSHGTITLYSPEGVCLIRGSGNRNIDFVTAKYVFKRDEKLDIK